ncbi:MAG: kelch repeat-containing protein [Candidatus Thermoplasmatota archaeon]|nr:kelch repeat-containing protein [Candidatus Thermoplasmatota archaeon]
MPRSRLVLLAIITAVVLAGCLTDGPSDAPGAGGPESPSTEPVAGQGTWIWSSLPAVPTPRTEVTAVVLGGDVVVLGGFTSNNAVSNAAEAFDIEEATWRSLPPMPVPLHHAPAVVYEGRIHVLGGHAGIPFVPQQVHLVYDMASGLWSQGTPLPSPRGAHGAAVLDGRAYLVGGVGPDGLVTRVDVYDLEADTWSTAAELPTAREHLAVASLDGRIHAVGGRTGGLESNLATHEALLPGEGWATLGPLPTARGGLGGHAVGGLLAVVGGESPEATHPEVEAWDPSTSSWSTLPDLPTPRHGLGVTAYAGTLYTAAGGPEPGLTTSGALEALTLAPTP